MAILILGPGGHGKDTLAEMLALATGMTFKSSSAAANELAVFPTMSKEYGYATLEECFADRRNHRIQWKYLISQYITPDKARLCREVLAECDMYVGMRCVEEYEASKHMFDHILWVDASRRIEKLDPSLSIPYDDGNMIYFGNNRSRTNLMSQVVAFVYERL